MPPAFELDQQRIADYNDTEVSALQALWGRVHSQAAELDPESAAYDDAIRKLNPKHQHGFMEMSQKQIWVTSVKNPAKGIRAGRVFTCPPILAAQMLVGGTHRLSSMEEIEGWHKDQANRKELLREAELIKNPPPPTPVFHIHTPPAEPAPQVRDSMPVALGKGHGAGKPNGSE